MCRYRRLSAAVAVGLLTGALVVVPGALVGAAEEAEIRMRALRFDPATLEVATGTTVIWFNDEPNDYPLVDGTHRIVAADGSFDSGDLQPLQRFSVDFFEPATIAFRCTIHPLLMTGELTVTGPPIEQPVERSVTIVEPSRSDRSTWGFRPADLVVEEGTTVTWRNNGAFKHSVKAEDGSFDSGLLAPGGSFTRSFDEPVALRYRCKPHGWMRGMVRVAGVGEPLPPRPPPPEPSDPLPEVEQPPRGRDAVTFTMLAVDGDDPDSWGFLPPSLRARVGDAVVWRNAGAITHTVTADDGSFDRELAPGETFRLRFEEARTIAFGCKPHPWMRGSILVVRASAKGGQAPPPVPAPPSNPSGRPPLSEPTPRPTSAALDPASAVRAPLAFGAAAAFVFLGSLIALPVLAESRRRLRATAIAAGEQTRRAA